MTALTVKREIHCSVDEQRKLLIGVKLAIPVRMNGFECPQKERERETSPLQSPELTATTDWLVLPPYPLLLLLLVQPLLLPYSRNVPQQTMWRSKGGQRLDKEENLTFTLQWHFKCLGASTIERGTTTREGGEPGGWLVRRRKLCHLIRTTITA